ncbi:urea-binding protein [Candidatus Protochlamydia naegleriophila]|uniref:Urea-binding protein n=1 Tax=Candidatus Protochlamydia naegleriophila TaxID=389348 RepID=A0A0U5JCK8_9BACT|nr:urea ABC transporter substrate-binding protein [Candidatus Protochlamydia naegleriophila]CUI16532.1 urea-binding protein [Candidatus Protochlamydia naegleriophila]
MRTLLAILFILLLIFQISLFVFDFYFFRPSSTPFKVGLVFSTTGFRAQAEKPALEAALMAIEEINQKGGIHERKIEPIIIDAQSDWEKAKPAIERLISKDHVDVFFGGWTKASRYTTKELFEKYNSLLINPFQFEGTLTSPNIIWVGATLNQQVLPTVAYILKNVGKRIYLVGSKDYILSHLISTMVKDQLSALEGEIVGETYIPIHEQEMDDLMLDIEAKKPDAILSSLISESNNAFYTNLVKAGVTALPPPVFSLSTDEIILQQAPEEIVGTYATWNYFQSIDTPRNHAFVKNFQTFSDLKAIDNATEATYLGVHLWAKAVAEAGTTNPRALSYILASMRIEAPEGTVIMDIEGRRAWKFVRIGQVQPNGQFRIVWQSKTPIRPVPFEIHRSQAEWDELTDYLYKEIIPPNASP